MLKEIIRKPKNKAIIIVIVIFLIAVVYCVVQPRKESISRSSKKIESKEFSAVSGDWKITKYIGESVEYHGAEANTEAERSENNKIIKEVKKKYLNRELHIDLKNITAFSPPTELGYQVLNLNDLFSIYRQPSDMRDGISPPFLCISFRLKDYEDSFGLIVDTKGVATLIVKGQFFRLDKTIKD